MTSADRVAGLIERRFGARLTTDTQRAELEALVAQRGQATGIAIGRYVQQLEARVADDELWRLATALTNGWTWFFRDRDDLERALANLRPLARNRPLCVWVAGCSTGEEAYTIAILAGELGLDLRVLGTDIDAVRLHTARAGTYAAASMRRMPRAMVERYFVAHPGHRFEATASLRSRVDFAAHNVMDAPPRPPDADRWDLVVCRNVLIHCAEAAVPQIVERLESAVARDGQLVLGAADRVGANLDGPPSPRASVIVPKPIAIAPKPRAIPVDPLALARVQIDAGAFEEARALLGRAVRDRPHDPDAHLLLGTAFAASHAFDRAFDHYAIAERLDPCDAEVHYLLGVVHRKREAWPLACEALRRATFLDPTLWPAWLLLAGAWERLGDTPRARRAKDVASEAVARRPSIAWRSKVDAFSVDRGVVVGDTRAPCLASSSPKRSNAT